MSTEEQEQEVEIAEGMRFESVEEEAPEVEGEESTTPDEPEPVADGDEDELSPEQIEPEGKDSVEPDEKPPEETPAEPQKEEDVIPYTNEEVQALLKEEVPQLDRRRLTQDQQLAINAVQGGLTAKLQERGELKKRLEEIETRIQQPQPQQGQKTVDQMFAENPQGVLAELRTAISQKESEDPLGEDVIKLRNLRDHLMEQYMFAQTDNTRDVAVSTTVFDNVRKAVPEYDEKVESLNQMAVDNYGFTREDIGFLTSPTAVINIRTQRGDVQYPLGNMIPKIVGAFHDLQVKTAKIVELEGIIAKTKSISDKEVKDEPTSVEKAGDGFEKPKKEPGSYEEDYFLDRHKKSIM
ncbi:hypothetical protein LCGC14_0467310 [marine sediment metagenome]|uniref:Uncharacterized protein n=1 Tax=marine sediment metagenome TaxID=412755 RepID=A0A0F9VM79_9ZZZZ